jgi:hypothetical protein
MKKRYPLGPLWAAAHFTAAAKLLAILALILVAAILLCS